MKILQCALALLCAIFMPVLIWVGAGTALYQCRKRVKLLADGVRTSLCLSTSIAAQAIFVLMGSVYPSRPAKLNQRYCFTEII